MSSRTAAWTVLGTFIMCVLGACSEPAYWIPGLTLPPGATNVSTKITHFTGGKQSLRVEFDCPGGWDAVAQHVGECMHKAGYDTTSHPSGYYIRGGDSGSEEDPEELSSASAQPEAGPEFEAGRDFKADHRFYVKLGKQIVTLENHEIYMQKFLKRAGSDPALRAKMKVADYRLIIREY
jgi:hypothetical protein